MGYNLDGTETARAIKLLKEMMDKAWLDGLQVEITKSPFKIKFTIIERGYYAAGFTLVEQVNCCGIMVSTQTFVDELFRGQGIAQQMMPLKEALAKEFGYTMLMATVNVSGNPAEVHILEKFGWSQGVSFVNKRTGNTVAIFTKILE